jgi:hypothetical protein
VVIKRRLLHHLLAVGALLAESTAGANVCVVWKIKKKVKRIQGQVLSCERETCTPWLGAIVRVTGSTHEAVATVDGEGRFSFDAIPPGHYLVEARHDAAAAITASVVVKAAPPNAREKHEISFVLGWDENDACYGGSATLVKAVPSKR